MIPISNLVIHSSIAVLGFNTEDLGQLFEFDASETFVLKKIYALFGVRPAAKPHRSKEDLYEYWRNPNDTANSPELYLGEKESQQKRSRYLVELVSAHLDTSGRVLELGCNVGRNLHYLYQAGYKSLSAIEINENALQLLKQSFPDSAAHASLHAGPIEDNIKQFDTQAFDLIFTMAVLEHVHSESEFIFAEMARVGRRVITIEDERSLSERHFPRNYRQIFESLGLVQLQETMLNQDVHGLSKSFVARVFERPASA